MALPQQVVEQLSHGTPKTPGWSSGILLFSGSIFLIIIFVYAGLRFGYEPYLNAQLSSLESQAQKLGQSVSPADEANLVTFYSQIANLQSLIANHVFFSQFLAWLGQNTEANVYYTNMIFSSGNQIALAGVAKTSADVLEQVAVFEASPNASAVSLSSVVFSPSLGGWVFDVVLTMKPSVFLWASGASAAVTSTTFPVALPTTTPAAAAVAPGFASTTTP